MGNVTDDFNRANGGLGANWTTVTGRGNPQILSNQVSDEAVGVPASESVYTGATFLDDQWALCTIIQLQDADSSLGTLIRAITASRTFYIMEVKGPLGATAVWSLQRVNAGIISTLISSTTVTLAANDVLYLEIIGYVLNGKLNDVLLPGFPYDDSGSGSKLVSGKPGIIVSSTTGLIPDALLDNFHASDIFPTPITGLGRKFVLRPQ